MAGKDDEQANHKKEHKEEDKAMHKKGVIVVRGGGNQQEEEEEEEAGDEEASAAKEDGEEEEEAEEAEEGDGAKQPRSARARWLMGMAIVFVVSSIWVISSFLVQYIEGRGIKALMLTYVCNSFFVILIPVVEGGRLLSTRGYDKRWLKRTRARLVQVMRTKRANDGDLRGRLFLYSTLKQVEKEAAMEAAASSLSSSRSCHVAFSASSPSITRRPDPVERILPLNSGRKAEAGGTSKTGADRGGDSAADSPIPPVPPSFPPSSSPFVSAPPLHIGASAEAGGVVVGGEVDDGCGEGGSYGKDRGATDVARQIPDYGGGGARRDEMGNDDCTNYGRGDGTSAWGAEVPLPLEEIIPLSRMETAMRGLVICPFWFLSQLTFNLSLNYTTVTANTILSTTSSLFTFLLSVIFLRETFTCYKLLCVFLCMVGTVVVSLTDTDSAGSGSGLQAHAPTGEHLIGRFHVSQHLIGDALTVFSGLIYSIYASLLKQSLPDESRPPPQVQSYPSSSATLGYGTGKERENDIERNEGTMLINGKKRSVKVAEVFGYIGLFNVLLFCPVVLTAHLLFEPMSITWSQFLLMFAKGIFDNVLSDVLWAKAVMLTTTTAATVGLSIQIPIATVADMVFKSVVPGLGIIVGAAMILVGFFGIYLPELRE